MPHILLCLSHTASQRLLLAQLAPHYGLSVADAESLDGSSADLVVLDVPALWRARGRLALWKAAARPVFAPVLLVAARQDLPQHDPAVWGVIDSFITTPVDPRELVARIELLLRTRADSLDQRQQLADLINYDWVTGLPSLLLLRELAAPALALGRPAALVVIALENLKLAEGALGTELVTGGLRALVARLLAALPPEATLASLGRDELACLLPNIDAAPAAADLVGRILEVAAQPIGAGGQELALAARAGVALAPADGADLDSLLARARTALTIYGAPGTYRFVSETLHAQAQARLQLLAGLHRAVARHEFVLHYQPQLDFAGERVIGVEALVRWQIPGGPIVPPNVFIPLAEESGLIIPMGVQVLRLACRQCRIWHEADLPLRVGVNLSACQLAEAALPDLVAATIRESGIAPSDLELEVTESAAIAQAGETHPGLDELARLGVGLAIDDFGTGYASLSYLAQLPANILKLDQSFVRGLPADATSRAITTAMIGLAHELGLRVIAEGVEDAAQAGFLRDRGCDEAQGFGISRPLPAEAVPAAVTRARQVG